MICDQSEAFVGPTSLDGDGEAGGAPAKRGLVGATAIPSRGRSELGHSAIRLPAPRFPWNAGRPLALPINASKLFLLISSFAICQVPRGLCTRPVGGHNMAPKRASTQYARAGQLELVSDA